MKKNKIWILFFVIIFISCNKNDNKEIYENIITDKRIKIKFIRSIKIGEDSTSIIGKFRNVKFYDGQIVIADLIKPTLFFMDKNSGNITKQISWTIGKGPGEIMKIANFEIVQKKIYISDMGNFRWSVYDSCGKFIQSKKPFYDPLSRVSGKYSENSGVSVSYSNRIFVGIIEPKYNRPYHQSKSKAIAILDTSLVIKKTFGFMDKIYETYNISNSYPTLTITNNGFIYFAQQPSYKIYKYDLFGNYIKVFGVKKKFKEIDENLPPFISRAKASKIMKKFSHTDALFSTNDEFIYHQYGELSDKFLKSKSPIDRNYFLKVYDSDGNYIPSDIKLPGRILTIGDENELYIYESDEPFNRIIGVYKIIIEEK